MLKKIAALLLGLLILQIALYAKLYAEEAPDVSSAGHYVKQNIVNDIKSENVEEYIAKLGIKTKVDEAELDKKYPGTKVLNSSDGNTTLRFHNPNANKYRLDIYDLNNGLIASFVNVNEDHVVIEKDMFHAGAYIYKLVGESNIYCGTFLIR